VDSLEGDEVFLYEQLLEKVEMILLWMQLLVLLQSLLQLRLLVEVETESSRYQLEIDGDARIMSAELAHIKSIP